MLVLQRMAGEVLYLTDGDGVVVGRVVVVNVRPGGAVRLGLDLPDGVRVYRDELALRSAEVGEVLELRGGTRGA